MFFKHGSEKTVIEFVYLTPHRYCLDINGIMDQHVVGAKGVDTSSPHLRTVVAIVGAPQQLSPPTHWQDMGPNPYLMEGLGDGCARRCNCFSICECVFICSSMGILHRCMRKHARTHITWRAKLSNMAHSKE